MLGLISDLLLLQQLACVHDANLIKLQFDTVFCYRQPILPKPGETAAARLRALGRDFHPECFKCEVMLTIC